MMTSRMFIVCMLMMCVGFASVATRVEAQEEPGKQFRQQRMEHFRQDMESVLRPGQIEQLQQIRQQGGQFSRDEFRQEVESVLEPGQIEQLQQIRQQRMDQRRMGGGFDEDRPEGPPMGMGGFECGPEGPPPLAE